MKVIGLMSGTSVDGIDAALVEITGKELDLEVDLLVGETFAYSPALQEKILAVCSGASLSMAALASLDDQIAIEFAQAARKIQAHPGLGELIGSHGQTVFHRPAQAIDGEQMGYSLQLGRGALIANLTGIPTVSNFRAADIAAGGQGAPLVPKVDAYLLSHPHKCRAIQNLGGIGNVTYLPAHQELDWEKGICGWDTGPGNSLLDLAVTHLTNGKQTFDRDGQWASQGTPNQSLVQQWLREEFFQQPPPKSTGRELFGQTYLQKCEDDAQRENLSPEDFLASLTELTVESIVLSYRHFLPKMPTEVLLCGGGSHNLYLSRRLAEKLAPDSCLLTTGEVGVNGDFKEAIAFAVLAYWRFACSLTGNLPGVTGAKQAMLLGEVHFPLVNLAPVS